jgi:antitoxin component of MazEF toxin-antitoxin module
MPSPSSEDRPIIKSRTGKFLQGIFDKKNSTPSDSMSTEPKIVAENPPEFIQMVPEPSTWDDTEESNWDDDFAEAPEPYIIEEPTKYAPPVTVSPVSTEVEAESDNSTQLMKEALRELSAPAQDQAIPENQVSRPPAPPPINPPNPEVANENKGLVEVNIPRPKNIKYKNQPSGADRSTSPSTRESIDARQESRKDRLEKATSKSANSSDDQAIEINIKRPTTIKYKTKAPEPIGPIAKLRASLDKVFRRSAPSLEKQPTATTAEVASGAVEAVQPKGGFKLPSLAMTDRKQILMIATAVFLALTAAWATINFWPQSAVVATAPVVQPAISPEAELVQSVQSKLQAVASKYPAGLISNLELAEEQQLAIVVVSNQWFNLTPAQRQQTAQSLWQQAVDYQMTRLEVRAMDDRLLARSPVVGGEAIVLDNF